MKIYHNIRIRGGTIIRLPTSLPVDLMPFVEMNDNEAADEFEKFKQKIDQIKKKV